jgi:hypothetical protein
VVDEAIEEIDLDEPEDLLARRREQRRRVDRGRVVVLVVADADHANAVARCRRRRVQR